jgi:tetratricopeptide (TPR) repeat protein
MRLREPKLVERARGDMASLGERLDPAYEPLSWARARELEGAARVAEGDSAGRAEPIVQGARLLADAAAQTPEDHSPLDWARLQATLGQGLMSLGEAADSEPALTGAQAAFDRAQRIYDRRPALQARSILANNRAACLAKRAERSGDLVALAQAEAAFKAELTEGPARSDPLAWAVAQLNLARVYEARDEIRGTADGRESAVLALSEALEVFTDRGLKTLAEAAQAALSRLEATERA